MLTDCFDKELMSNQCSVLMDGLYNNAKRTKPDIIVLQ